MGYGSFIVSDICLEKIQEQEVTISFCGEGGIGEQLSMTLKKQMNIFSALDTLGITG